MSRPQPAESPPASGRPLPPKAGPGWHRIRKATHVVCFAIFLILPFFDLMRFDIPRQRFYFLGQELWISEFGVIFYTLMFLLFVIAAAALLYGRVYCGYLCPQMIFSEASLALEKRLESFVSRRTGGWTRQRRRTATRALLYVVLVPVSIGLAFIFISYFVEPRDLLRKLMALDVNTAGGVAGAATTLLVFLDFAFLRLRFCTLICPYGYLQGILSDDKSLHVCYQDERHECIECKKCLKVCHMGIDIRNSPLQIECVHCGECIDVCDDVMGRLGKPGLIHYAWGVKPPEPGVTRSWFQRVGLSDAKRVVILLIVCAYASGLWVTLAMRSSVLVRVVPDRSTLYTLGADGGVSNHFRMTVANRGQTAARLGLAVQGLAGARIVPGDSLTVAPGASLTHEFDLVVSDAPPGVSPIRFVAGWTPERGRRDYPMTFIAPEAGGPR